MSKLDSGKTHWVMGFFIAIGFIMLLVGKFIVKGYNNTIGEIMELLGTTLSSVFSVSFLYEEYIAKHYLERFNGQLHDELSKMEAIQNKCTSLGIDEIFKSQDDFIRKHPLANIVEQSNEVICVGMTLFNLFGKTNEIMEGLHKGVNFKFACIDPDCIEPNGVNDDFIKAINFRKDDVTGALGVFESDFLIESEKQKPSGKLELKYHHITLFDTILIFTVDNKEFLALNLTFGRSSGDKSVIVLNTSGYLGASLKKRYMNIYNNAETKATYSKGEICNKLGLKTAHEKGINENI